VKPGFTALWKFAEQSRPALAAAQMPMPSRVLGFEVTSYLVS
jgi:hypothetical protein